MGGEITVVSEHGIGSTFTIRVPAIVGGKDAESSMADALRDDDIASALLPADAASWMGSLVLVIDDDPAVRELMERFLAREGYQVYSAASGREGLHLAHTLRPQAITLDVMMPDIDGWMVLAALKADPDLLDIPVIMMTIGDDSHIGYTLGATDYLTKPIDRDQLVAMLHKYRRDQGAAQVLVIENDPATRELLQRTLANEGWEVDVAANGRAGLEQVARRRPKLILLDLMMPEMDGFAFAAEMHARADWRSIPIIVVTAKDLTLEDRLRLNGAVERYIQKGTYTSEALLAEVRDLVAARIRQ